MTSIVTIMFRGGSTWDLPATEPDATKFLSDYYSYIADDTAVLGADFGGKLPFRVRIREIAGVFVRHQ